MSEKAVSTIAVEVFEEDDEFEEFEEGIDIQSLSNR